MIHCRIEKETIEVKFITSITCDCCKKEYVDTLDRQEFLHIDDTGGYNSTIGDDVHYQCDLCSECVKRLLGKYIRICKGCKMDEGSINDV